MNSAQFIWSPSTGLNLNTALFTQDSIASKIYTGMKDTTWSVLGEPVSKYRFLTLKKPFWSNPLPYPDWKWYYKSVNETGTITARDSFTVMNHADMTFDEVPFEVFGVNPWSDCDTVTLPERGLYMITYDCSVLFPYSEVAGVNARDTARLRLVNELNVDIVTSYSELWKEFNDGIRYYPEAQTLSKTFTVFNSVPGTKYYLQVFGALNSGLITIAVTKPSITYLLVR